LTGALRINAAGKGLQLPVPGDRHRRPHPTRIRGPRRVMATVVDALSQGDQRAAPPGALSPTFQRTTLPPAPTTRPRTPVCSSTASTPIDTIRFSQ